MRFSMGKPFSRAATHSLAQRTFLATQLRFMQASAATQRMIQADQQKVQPFTDYDLDKERWSKQMKFASMDCVLEPDIHPVKWTSFKGLRKAWKRFITMRKIIDRRPDYHVDKLRDLYIKYKQVSNSREACDTRTMASLTTHNEANRIAKIQEKKMNEQFSKSSWKSLKTQNFTSEYEIVVDTFEVVHCYMGQMTSDDWIQITVKVRGKERHKKGEEMVDFLEYPCFEVKLGDGIKSANLAPFIVVAVLDKDGSRIGKDGQDAAMLRKALGKNKPKLSMG